jgi:cytochrome c peroxidase
VIDIVEWDPSPYTLEYGIFPEPSIADDNKLTIQGVQLGRMLFYEKILSKDGTQACASCHMQEFAFSDTAKFSIGVQGLPGKRQAMAVFNMAWHNNEFFWEGRAHLLRDQALMPIQDELEMDETLENVIAKLSANQMYKDQFMRAFGSEEITSEKMSLAMEQFMNSIVTNNSKYDQFLNDSSVFNPSEKRGFDLFFTEYNQFFPDESGADCAHCHSGDNFENDLYMNNGLEAMASDIGREEVTKNAGDKGKFKVTSLRNIELTPPYMHDGRFSTLEEVVEHYNSGLKSSPTLDPALEQTRGTGLMLSEQDKIDLVAFLKTLTDNDLISNNAYSNPF